MKRERLTLVSFIRDLASRSRNVCDESLLDTGTRFMRSNLRNRADYDQDFPFVFISLLARPWHSSWSYHRQSITVDRIVGFSGNENRNISTNGIDTYNKYSCLSILTEFWCSGSGFFRLKIFVDRWRIICTNNWRCLWDFEEFKNGYHFLIGK